MLDRLAITLCIKENKPHTRQRRPVVGIEFQNSTIRLQTFVNPLHPVIGIPQVFKRIRLVRIDNHSLFKSANRRSKILILRRLGPFIVVLYPETPAPLIYF